MTRKAFVLLGAVFLLCGINVFLLWLLTGRIMLELDDWMMRIGALAALMFCCALLMGLALPGRQVPAAHLAVSSVAMAELSRVANMIQYGWRLHGGEVIYTLGFFLDICVVACFIAWRRSGARKA